MNLLYPKRECLAQFFFQCRKEEVVDGKDDAHTKNGGEFAEMKRFQRQHHPQDHQNERNEKGKIDSVATHRQGTTSHDVFPNMILVGIVIPYVDDFLLGFGRCTQSFRLARTACRCLEYPHFDMIAFDAFYYTVVVNLAFHYEFCCTWIVLRTFKVSFIDETSNCKAEITILFHIANVMICFEL